MSRPAWMTDELEEEWVEPEWDGGSAAEGETSQRSQLSRRSHGGSRVQRSPHVYGSVRVASSSAGSGSGFGGSMKERSMRDLLELDGGEECKAQEGVPAVVVSLTPDGSPVAGTFLIREDVAPEPLKIAPAALGLKKSGVKNFFSPLALERMFEPPSPPPDTKPAAQAEPRSMSPSPTSNTASSSTHQIGTAPATTTSTTPTSLALSKSPGGTTPSPHASLDQAVSHRSSLSPSPSTTSSSVSFIPSPSAGRGPLGTFRLPRNPHAPIRPSRLSESHLIKPYASFEADETSSSRSSLPKDVLGDVSQHVTPETSDGQARTSVSPSITELIGAEEDEERLTNDFDFGDDEFVVGDDVEAEDADGEADSILDPSTSDIRLDRTPQGGLARQQQGQQVPPGARAQPEPGIALEKQSGATELDEIIDTDIPGLALFDGRKPSSSYQFTFSDPRHESNVAQTSGTPADTPRKKTREDRKREREEERQHRNATRALLHPHNALRSITPDVDLESRPSSRSDSVDEQDQSLPSHGESPAIQSSEAQPSRSSSRATLSRDDQRTPSPSVLPLRDPRLKLFQFHYDTFTRDHLSALVDSIAVGSVGSSPSIKVDTMEFRGEDPRALSTPSDAVRYAKKIKLTPPEEYSDWDGEQSAEEDRERAEHTDDPTSDGQQYLRPPSTGRNYAADARNLMLAMRAARSFDGDSVASATRQEEQDLSTESSATDYRRRGADLMAQIRGEMSDEEGDGSGSVRDGSVRDGSVSVRGGSMVIRSPQASLAELTTHLRSGREVAAQDSMEQLSTSIRAMRLGDQDQRPTHSSPARFLQRSNGANEVLRDVATRSSGAGTGTNGAYLPQPPTIMILDITTPDPPRLQSGSARGGERRTLSETQRIQSQVSTSASTHSHLEPQHPSTSPAREDMNRFVSSSTVHTKSTACSAESFVKHPGPPASVLSHSGSGVRQIAPADLPADALPDRIGKMVYDRQAMRWRQEATDGDLSDGSEDPFKDFESFLSGGGGDQSEDEGSAPMEEDDEQEQEPVEQPTREDIPNFEPRLPNLGPDTSGYEATTSRIPLRPALKSASSTPTPSGPSSRQSTVDPTTPMPDTAKNRRSVSFSDGRLTGKIRGLVARDESESESPSEITSLTLTPPQSDYSPSSRMKRIGNLLDELEDDSMLASLSIAPGNQSSGESDEETTEHSDMGHGDPDVDPDVSRAPRTSARTYSFGASDRGGSHRQPAIGNGTFLTECSFGVAHDRLVQLITDVHPYQPYWEPLGEIDLSKKGIESLARLKEFLPNLDRLDVRENELTYLSGIPGCLRELNVAKNHLTSLTSYGHLVNLEVLDISNNQIDSIGQLKCLRHLRELSAAENTISDLSGIAQTRTLTKLNLKGNSLKSLSLEECSWPRVENIDFSGNGMKSISGLSNLTTLVTLNLDHNALNSLDIDGPLPRLRVLRLSDNKLTELDCSAFTNLRTLYADNNRLGNVRHADKARRLENLSLRNQSGRGLHLSVADVRDVKRMYLSGNPLENGFLEVPCYNLIYLELAACRLSALPTDLSRLIPNIRVLNLNYNFLSDVRPLDGLVRLRKLTIIGSRLKATKPLLRSLQSMKEIEMLDFRMNPFSLGWYLPLLVRDVPGALQPSEATGKRDAPWSDLDVKFRRDLPDELYIGRLAYRGLVMRVCTQLRVMDGIEITAPERAKAQKLLAGIEKSHKAKLGASAGKD
ncbi:hypothetical protein FRC06_000267 [Ceratobasidium sp. 370]|nr:hypothetical protein FRC06_000267 [Ceratobasidium sp. 370]